MPASGLNHWRYLPTQATITSTARSPMPSPKHRQAASWRAAIDVNLTTVPITQCSTRLPAGVVGAILGVDYQIVRLYRHAPGTNAPTTFFDHLDYLLYMHSVST
jgi:hypothetical protein